MLGSPTLHLKGIKILMLQLSSFYCKVQGFEKVSQGGSLSMPASGHPPFQRLNRGPRIPQPKMEVLPDVFF